MKDIKNALIVGATSDIAHEVARKLAAGGVNLVLAGRDEKKLQAIQQDLTVIARANCIHYHVLDVNSIEKHKEAIDFAVTTLKELDFIFLAQGVLGEQKKGEEVFDELSNVFTINFLSVASLVHEACSYFTTTKRSGCIAAISSVAGDRGRKSNYIYGSSKAALSVFLEGVRLRMEPYDVSVIDIKPGFVATKMTRDFKKNFLFAEPSAVAKQIVEKLLKNRSPIYVPWFWKWIMFFIKLLPEGIFKRLPL
jgi:decaprenylphospho-beta-D-erythro-pentofuranosid-2-ulose 2-reductase